MSKHPLNQAIISQLLSDLRNGQLRRALDMGFSEEIIRLLKDPEIVSVLSNSPVRWSTVKIDLDVMHRILNRIHDSDKEIQIIDSMLKLGASSKLIYDVFGLDPREVAFRKRVLNIEQKRGRWQEVTEEQNHQLWREWKAKITEYKLDINNVLDMSKICMILAKNHKDENIAMAMIWQAIEKWIIDENGTPKDD